MKILTVVGARPQFIKSAMFSKEINKTDIKEIIVHTGQHYDENMSKIFFDDLGMKKEDYNLNINGGSHASQTGQMIIKIEEILLKEKPNLIVLFGDTNSTIAGSLAASKLGIPVAHIEAGFRSFDKTMPEEINRVVTDHLSDYLFCFTESTVELLKQEGITKNVFYVGDITYDAALYFSKIAEKSKPDFITEKDYIYCTVHRQSNTDSKENLENIFEALADCNETVILPLHPRTKARLESFNLYDKYKDKLKIIEPVGYFESLLLCKNAKKVVTDSGGVLRESYFFKKPCIILRDNVEFKESVENKEAILVGANKETIIDAIQNFQAKGEFKSFFGDGTCAKQIVSILKELM